MPLLALIASWFAKNVGFETIKYLAMRAFLYGLFLTLGPIVIFWGYSYIMQHTLSYASTYLGSFSMEGVQLNVSDFGGWLASQLRVGEGISILLSFALLSFTLKAMRLK